MKTAPHLMILAVLPVLAPSLALSALDSSKVVKAETKKTNTYLRDGVIVGGNADVRDVLIEDIRRAKNDGFERVVVDLKNPTGPEAGDNPFFQVSVEPDRKKVIVSVFGKARTGFNAQKIQGLFQKSSMVQKLELLPQVDQGVWMFSMTLKDAPAVEVFHLESPSRLILDMKAPTGVRSGSATKSRTTDAESTEKVKKSAKRSVSKPRAQREAAPSQDEIPNQAKDAEEPLSTYDEMPE